MDSIDARLIALLRRLPPSRVAQVVDFVELLVAREGRAAPAQRLTEGPAGDRDAGQRRRSAIRSRLFNPTRLTPLRAARSAATALSACCCDSSTSDSADAPRFAVLLGAASVVLFFMIDWFPGITLDRVRALLEHAALGGSFDQAPAGG
jgi:hypothetical protein